MSLPVNAPTSPDLGEDDNERISLADPQQVARWASKLGASAELLRELVAQVGPRVADIRQRLRLPQD